MTVPMTVDVRDGQVLFGGLEAVDYFGPVDEEGPD